MEVECDDNDDEDKHYHYGLCQKKVSRDVPTSYSSVGNLLISSLQLTKNRIKVFYGYTLMTYTTYKFLVTQRNRKEYQNYQKSTLLKKIVVYFHINYLQKKVMIKPNSNPFLFNSNQKKKIFIED